MSGMNRGLAKARHWYRYGGVVWRGAPEVLVQRLDKSMEEETAFVGIVSLDGRRGGDGELFKHCSKVTSSLVFRNRSVIVDGRTSGLPDGGAHGRSVKEVCAAVIDIASSFLVMELDRQPLPSDFVHSGGTAAVLGWPVHGDFIANGERSSGWRHRVDVLCEHRCCRKNESSHMCECSPYPYPCARALQ